MSFLPIHLIISKSLLSITSSPNPSSLPPPKKNIFTNRAISSQSPSLRGKHAAPRGLSASPASPLTLCISHVELQLHYRLSLSFVFGFSVFVHTIFSYLAWSFLSPFSTATSPPPNCCLTSPPLFSLSAGISSSTKPLGLFAAWHAHIIPVMHSLKHLLNLFFCLFVCFVFFLGGDCTHIWMELNLSYSCWPMPQPQQHHLSSICDLHHSSDG